MKKEWIRRCDFFNVPTSLSYKSEYFYTTKFGAFLSIMFFIIILDVITYEIVILYRKTQFTLISNKYTELSEQIDFSQNPILFKLTNDRGKNIDIDNKLYSIEAYIIEMYFTFENGTKKNNLITTRIELEKCDKIYANNTEYSELNLSSYICIKPDQNLTAYGLLGDLNNPFRGIRIYINKCSDSDCYNDDEILQKLHNSKFLVTYVSLSSIMFYLKNQSLNYQLFTKSCSLSTNILKKILFTYDIGKFYLYNNIILKNKLLSFNYIVGNDYSVDMDLDSTTTNKKDSSTLAYISFHYSGNVIETRKDVQTLYEAFSIIGNIFNIILTIFKIINSYYSNKILFVDIFRTIFFTKEYMNSDIKGNICLNNNCIKFKKNNNLDISNEICLDNNKNKPIKSQSNKNIIIPFGKNFIFNRRTKTYEKLRDNIKKKNIIYFYLLPIWILRKSKAFNKIYLIKDRICEYFSIEKINELIKFKENIETKSLKSKLNKTELIPFNYNNFENNSINDVKNNKVIK